MNYLKTIFIQSENIRKGISNIFFEKTQGLQYITDQRQFVKGLYKEYKDFEEFISNPKSFIEFSNVGYSEIKLDLSMYNFSFFHIYSKQIETEFLKENSIINLYKFVNSSIYNTKLNFTISPIELFEVLTNIFNIKRKDENKYKEILKRYGIIFFVFQEGKNRLYENLEKQKENYTKNYYLYKCDIYYTPLLEILQINSLVQEGISDLYKYGIYQKKDEGKIQKYISKIFEKKFNGRNNILNFSVFNVIKRKKIFYYSKENYLKHILQNKQDEDYYFKFGEDSYNFHFVNLCINDLLSGLNYGGSSIELYNSSFFEKFGIKQNYLEDCEFLLDEIYKSFIEKQEKYKEKLKNYLKDNVNGILKSNRKHENIINEFSNFLYGLFGGYSSFSVFNSGLMENGKAIKDSIKINEKLLKLKEKIFDLTFKVFNQFFDSLDEKTKNYINESIQHNGATVLGMYGVNLNGLGWEYLNGFCMLENKFKEENKIDYKIFRDKSIFMTKLNSQGIFLDTLSYFDEHYLFMKKYKEYKNTIIGNLIKKELFGALDESIYQNGIMKKKKFEIGKDNLLDAIDKYFSLCEIGVFKRDTILSFGETKEEIKNNINIYYDELFKKFDKNFKISKDL